MNIRLVRRRKRAFSLIEILIAVIILALGLLGLGVVFPVVIREQKLAQGRIYGAMAENNIAAMLGGLEKLNRARSLTSPWRPAPDDSTLADTATTLEAVYTGWSVLKEEWEYYKEVSAAILAAQNNGSGVPKPDFRDKFAFSKKGQWETLWGINDNAFMHAPSAYGSYNQRGDIEIVSRDINFESAVQSEFPASEFLTRRALLDSKLITSPMQFNKKFLKCRIPLSARINPGGDPGNESPGTVWDMVVRRKLEVADPRSLQVAVFVRRIDPRLRPEPRSAPRPGDDTVPVREQIFGTQERLPVGEDNRGLPTLDGTDGIGGLSYSPVHTVFANFRYTPNDPISRKRDHIDVAGFSVADEAFLGQPGQRVVDNLGNIYTVVRLDQFGLKVDPPVPPSVLEDDGSGDPRQATIRQLIFTLQIPVSVFVVEIEP